MKWLKDKVEGMEAQSSSPFIYALNHSQLFNEGILPCIDINAESMMKMKATGSKERLITGMHLLQQATLSFTHARLAVNSDHRFVFTALVRITSWLEKEVRQTKLPVSCPHLPIYIHTHVNKVPCVYGYPHHALFLSIPLPISISIALHDLPPKPPSSIKSECPHTRLRTHTPCLHASMHIIFFFNTTKPTSLSNLPIPILFTHHLFSLYTTIHTFSHLMHHFSLHTAI
ncbi:hypothetical protein PVL29_019471 [Vitis rotundifolia]|uniref:Uncharacterized protein n=1 Tax=Vitis rotundifolia TaxID=103349 RepID=A0AA39DCR7_VITRO|nr:hypothetical protein PVL29_019471 [Vitis rotundifolia]